MTIALTIAYAEAPASRCSRTAPPYQEIETVSVKKQKYGTKEFISQLIANDRLPSASAATD